MNKRYIIIQNHVLVEISLVTTINVLEVGDEVTEGQVIGYVNSTGTSTGNHLHFEIRKNGNQISPNRFFGYQDVTGSCNPHVEDVTLDKNSRVKM